MPSDGKKWSWLGRGAGAGAGGPGRGPTASNSLGPSDAKKSTTSHTVLPYLIPPWTPRTKDSLAGQHWGQASF